MNSGIYKIVNTVNGKCYVGSAKDFDKRWNRHISDLKKNKHSSIKLQRSFNKHGIDNFKFEVIEYVEYDKNIIVSREDYWISKLNSKHNGYNIADASFGDVLTTHPDRDNIINRIRGSLNKNMSNMTPEERKDKWGRSGCDNGMFGKNHTNDAKKKMSDYRLGKSLEELYGDDRANDIRNNMIATFDDVRRKQLSEFAASRTGDKNSFFGKNHNEETKRKISEKNSGKISPFKGRKMSDYLGSDEIRSILIKKKINSGGSFVVVDGVEYVSVTEANKLSDQKVEKHRLKSKNIRFYNMYWSRNPKFILCDDYGNEFVAFLNDFDAV